jgi:amino acid permease
LPSDRSDLFSRGELLEGLPARRASTLLYLIECRVSYLVTRARRAMDPYLSEEVAADRDLAFLEAFALGRQPSSPSTIQEVERYAPNWAPLVPDNPRVRAAVAHLLGKKYRFASGQVPQIRRALGLDEDEVRAAYRRGYGDELDGLYAEPADRFRWSMSAVSARLESLPPFWTVFSLTLTETVGAGTLALPIAVAGVGPIAGAVVLLLIGIVNMITVACMAEAAARSGTIRYGGFIGRMVSDYLGTLGSMLLTASIACICFVALIAYYVGFSTTLAGNTGLPPQLWAAVLFAFGLYFLKRESLSATVASALLIGAVNTVTVLILALVGFLNSTPENLFYVNIPILNGEPFDPSVLQLVFGVVLCAYFGHLSVGNCATTVLKRDPSARSLIWGVVAAQGAAMVIYILWIFGVNGALGPEVLAREQGTALTPLANKLGPAVQLLGSFYAVLGISIASIHFSLALFNLVRERLPIRAERTIVLPRQRGRLLLHPRGRHQEEPLLSITYLGMDGEGESASTPRFDLDIRADGKTMRKRISLLERHEEPDPRSAEPTRANGGLLSLEAIEADGESARIKIVTPLSMRFEGEWEVEGSRMSDLLELPEDQRTLFIWLMRQGDVKVDRIADCPGIDRAMATGTLAALIEKGFVWESGNDDERTYGTRLAGRRRRALPKAIWKALDADPAQTNGGHRDGAPQLREAMLSAFHLLLRGPGRFLICASPVIVAFCLAEWQLFSGTESFSGPLGFTGVVVDSLLSGIFPVLLLLSSRRTGDYAPQSRWRAIGNPLVIGGIYLLYLANLFLHGLVLWDDPLMRVAALAVGAVVPIMTYSMVRRGSFSRRAVVELLNDGSGQEKRTTISVTVGGESVPAAITLNYGAEEKVAVAGVDEIPAPSSLQLATVELADQGLRSLKVWAHRVSPEGISQGMAASLRLPSVDGEIRFDLRPSGGQVVVPLQSGRCKPEIDLPEGAGG